MTRVWPSREEWVAAAERSVRTACLPLERVPEGAEHYLTADEVAEMNRLNVQLAQAARPILTAEIARFAEELPKPAPTARTRRADFSVWLNALDGTQMRMSSRMFTLRHARTDIGRQAKADPTALTTWHWSPLTYTVLSDVVRDLLDHLDGWQLLYGLDAKYQRYRWDAAREAEEAAVAKAIKVRSSDEGWARELERRARIDDGPAVRVREG
ncbi:hypothetical protein ABT340_39395 [Streptosporangium sp. NPDC000239]|uniref:hypothetical protein n=1 Tax=Streptosporangium sp. NPDC000239 TaxID=3154248 RepID=UPI00332EBD0D